MVINKPNSFNTLPISLGVTTMSRVNIHEGVLILYLFLLLHDLL